MQGKYSSLEPEIKEGKFIWNHSNGNLKHSGEYSKNLQIGEHIWYFENGNIDAIENYQSGKLDGPFKEYYENGAISNETSFLSGQQNGVTKDYREDGSLYSEGNFKNGDRKGIWKYYNNEGAEIGREEYATDFNISEANMFFKLPNSKWFLSSKNIDVKSEYVFKREGIVDGKGQEIIPAIMLYIEDASSYEDLIVFAASKQMPFRSKGIDIDEIVVHENDNYPISYKNSMWYKCHYNSNGQEHLFYMIYIITQSKKGIQLYMDMTKSVAKEYEQEFIETLKTLKEQ